MEGIKLNIGAGSHPLDGYVNLDRKTGQEAYPLDYKDESVDEVRASHVLEHFSHRRTVEVLRDWYRVLKPGGKMRIAVPDFEVTARAYLNGNPLNTQGVVMGSHVDDDDHHGAVFDRECLEDAMRLVGLANVRRWKSDCDDCSRYDVSLNLEGFKPTRPIGSVKVAGVMSVPRLLWADGMIGCLATSQQLGIPFTWISGAFWGQCLSRSFLQTLDDERDFEYILTVDYDTVFTVMDVVKLTEIMEFNPDIAILCTLQQRRITGKPLMTMVDESGEHVPKVDAADMDADAVDVNTGHFGLTLIRTSVLKELPHPWFVATPGKNGRWDEPHVDEDIHFWRLLKEHGHRRCVAPRVVVGHIQPMVLWPDQNWDTIHQNIADYNAAGKPMGTFA